VSGIAASQTFPRGMFFASSSASSNNRYPKADLRVAALFADPVDGRLVLVVAPLSKGGARRIDHITELARAADRQKMMKYIGNK